MNWTVEIPPSGTIIQYGPLPDKEALGKTNSTFYSLDRSQLAISVESCIKKLELEKNSYAVNFIGYKVLKQVVLAVLEISEIITNCWSDLLMCYYSDFVWEVL